jgi:hypothetical protein
MFAKIQRHVVMLWKPPRPIVQIKTLPNQESPVKLSITARALLATDAPSQRRQPYSRCVRPVRSIRHIRHPRPSFPDRHGSSSSRSRHGRPARPSQERTVIDTPAQTYQIGKEELKKDV